MSRGHEKRKYRFKDGLVVLVRNAIAQWEVQSVVFAFRDTDVLERGEDVTGYSRKILTRNSPVPGKNSPYLWKLTVMTLSVV